jgi:uncharacterized protein YqgC (DUF456 family)
VYKSPTVGASTITYLRIILSAVAAILLAEFVPGPWSMFRGMSTEKATSLGAVVGGFIGSLFSPLFWNCERRS